MNLFTEEERIAGLIEVISADDGPELERTPATRLHELYRFDDEGGLWALTPVTAPTAPGYGYENCTVVWRADVDGLHARCTLLSSEGDVLAQWEAHGNA